MEYIGKAGTAEVRANPRYRVFWRIVIIYNKDGKKNIFHGHTYDVSISGACIFSDHNIFVDEPVAMTMEVHSLHLNKKNPVIGMKCRMLYNILSSNYSTYRIGVEFIEFDGDGKKLLKEALRNNQFQIVDQPKGPGEQGLPSIKIIG